MTSVQLVQLHISQQLKTSIDDIVSKATKALQNSSAIQDFSIGAVQDEDVVQILFRNSDSANSASATTQLLDSLSDLSNTPPTTFHVNFNTPPFAPSSPAKAPLCEFAQSWFPASEATPAFKQKIEQDFAKFTEIFKREAKGDVGCVWGWVEEELEKEDVKGGKATGFVVVRGWETMEDFKASTGTESFREAAPILFGWGVPYRMWFVERRGGGSGD